MALARTQREWAILVGEYNICKKKLESKREALKIITKEWQLSKKEIEVYKNKVNQLQQDLDKLIRNEQTALQQTLPEEGQPARAVGSPDLVNTHSSKDTLAQLVHEYKTANKALRHDFQELKKLYIESQEDVQLMRERMRSQSSSSSVHGDEFLDTVTEGKEECILQLEEYKQQLAILEQEVKCIKDENSDVASERDCYKEKCERLNIQLNYILGADDKRLVDIDALVLDNKYLKEKLALLEEERQLEKESILKYEAAFEKKKNKILHHGNDGRLASYYAKRDYDHSLKTVQDLRNVASILSEAITEKNLALSHQRSANRILGRRVSELENKLKTLEVAGLWSLPGHRGYGSTNLGNNGLDMNEPCELMSSCGKQLPDKVNAVHGSDWKTNAANERRESSMLAKPNNDDVLSNAGEINGSLLKSDCCESYAENCYRRECCTAEKRPNNIRWPCPSSFEADLCSSPDFSSSFLQDSPVLAGNFAERKLSRVSSAPCLSGSLFCYGNGEISS